MPYTNLKNKVAIIVLALSTTAFASPAFAGPQDDVKQCRIAMTAQSNIDMNSYRLRFEGQQGHRARTVYLRAIPTKKSAKKGSKAFQFSCEINRIGVVALKQKNKIQQFAEIKPSK